MLPLELLPTSWPAPARRALVAVSVGMMTACGGGRDPGGAEAAYRYRAPIEVTRPAPFVRLPLDPEVYAR
jgi:hypothetical protein